MRNRKRWEDYDTCPVCRNILKEPRLAGRYEEKNGIRYLVTTKRVVCPMCGEQRETEHWRRSYADEIAAAARR